MKMKDFAEVLKIFAKYSTEYDDVFGGAEHDTIYFNFSEDQIPEDSEDGKRLIELGLRHVVTWSLLC